MSDATAARPCGCPVDEQDHLEPEPDWIGDTPIMHGEREGSWWATLDQELFGGPCLCGHPTYTLCPGDRGGWGGDVGDAPLRWRDPSDGDEAGSARG